MPGAVGQGRYTGVDDDCHIHQSSNQSAPRTTRVLTLIPQKLHQGALLSHFPDQETGSGRRKDHTVLGHTVSKPQSQTQSQICLDPKLYPLSYPCYSSISFSSLSLPVILFVIYVPPRAPAFSFPWRTSSPKPPRGSLVNSYSPVKTQLGHALQAAFLTPPV